MKPLMRQWPLTFLLGTVLACASSNCLVYLLEKASHKVRVTPLEYRLPTNQPFRLLTIYFMQVTALEGHSGSVEALCFGHNAQCLYSGGADGLITIWQ